MIFLQNISYIHPNKDLLFDNINLTVNNQQKIALIGHNGTGKSTLLKIIARELTPSGGHLKVESTPYYIPQIFGQYNHLTIAQALKIEDKINALHQILNGNVTEDYLNELDDDWGIEERTQAALSEWQLDDLDWNQKMDTLSGGQKTKVFLAGVAIHQPALILMDEPSNHLDSNNRKQLYDLVQSTTSTVIVVSHDRQLLNLLDTTCELSKRGISMFGGNYDFYAEQKQIEIEALNQDIHSKEKTLRKAKEKERETLERQQKLDARGKKKQENAGIARIMMNTLRNNAENSTAKIKSIHSEKISGISEQLHELRSNLPDLDKMKFGFDNSALHKGKILLTATNINFGYTIQSLWKENLSFQIKSGERIAFKGLNGSGKTTLIRLLLGDLQPSRGVLERVKIKSVYIDQDYSLIDRQLTVYQQAQKYNIMTLEEHEIKIRLNRFLFSKEKWDKPCSTLSGGESMRLMLCCLTVQSQAPDIIILDEPTNNLDLQNIGILTAAINEYQGTVIVVSHDERFLEEINIQQTLQLVR